MALFLWDRTGKNRIRWVRTARPWQAPDTDRGSRFPCARITSIRFEGTLSASRRPFDGLGSTPSEAPPHKVTGGRL